MNETEKDRMGKDHDVFRTSSSSSILCDIINRNDSVSKKEEEESIPVLNTATLVANEKGNTGGTVLRSFLQLLIKDPLLVDQLRSCRDFVIGVSNQLKNHDSECQATALELVSLILKVEDASPSPLVQSNLDMIMHELGALLAETLSISFRSRLLRLLKDSFDVSAISEKIKTILLHALVESAQSETIDITNRVESVESLLYGIRNLNAHSDFMEALSTLLVVPLPVCRQLILRELDYTFLWYPRDLVDNDNMVHLLDSLSILISHGSPQDSKDATYLCHRILKEPSGMKCILEHGFLIRCLVNLAMDEQIKYRPAFINTINILLEMQACDNGLQCILKYPDTLPLMVKLAQRTTDQDLKRRLVTAIIRFTKAKLKEFSF
jgi:hypothetical protein